MIDFTYDWETKILFGKSHLDNIDVYLEQHNVKRVLIVHDSGDYLEQERLMPIVRKNFEENKIDFLELGGIVPNPTLVRIKEIVEESKIFNPDFVLAIGGGSVIDSAKIIANMLVEPQHTDAFLDGTVEVNGSLPIGVVLTIASAGSEVSRGAIINIDEKRKRVIESDWFLPKFAILNPELTISLPKYHTAAGGCDIIFHTFERYFSPSSNTILTDKMGEGLIKAVMSTLQELIRNPSCYNLRATLMWAGTISHNGILGTGKEEDWGVHMIAHELSGHYQVIHGASICAIWGSWARFVAKQAPKRFINFATNVMGCDTNALNDEMTIEMGIRRFENFMKNVGMPVTLGEIGIELTQDDRIKIADSALEQSDYIGNFLKLYPEDIIEILKFAK